MSKLKVASMLLVVTALGGCSGESGDAAAAGTNESPIAVVSSWTLAVTPVGPTTLKDGALGNDFKDEIKGAPPGSYASFTIDHYWDLQGGASPYPGNGYIGQIASNGTLSWGGFFHCAGAAACHYTITVYVGATSGSADSKTVGVEIFPDAAH